MARMQTKWTHQWKPQRGDFESEPAQQLESFKNFIYSEFAANHGLIFIEELISYAEEHLPELHEELLKIENSAEAGKLIDIIESYPEFLKRYNGRLSPLLALCYNFKRRYRAKKSTLSL